MVVNMSLSEIKVGEHSHKNFLAFFVDIQQVCGNDVEGGCIELQLRLKLLCRVPKMAEL